MSGEFRDAVSVLGGFSWLTGPIFDKELRVASRRRRSYVLRSGYIGLLCLFILYVWLATFSFGGGGSAAYLASRMAEAGRRVITAIIWFQFVAAQLIAVVLLSTSIGGEIRQRTLSVLMTTPINSLQIVVGKLLGNLLQVVLLLATSLPLLAIVRVFGGVPWNHVVTSLCITLTAAVFAGSVSLLLSINSRQAYTVVLTIVTGYLVVFGVSAAAASLLLAQGLLSSTPLNVLLYLINPFGALVMALSMGKTGGVASSAALHCAIMLLATVAVVALAVCRVRSITLSQAFGGGGKRLARKKRKPSPAGRRSRASAAIMRVKGPPVVWKEMRQTIFRRRRISFILYAALAGMIMVGYVLVIFGFGRGLAGGGVSYLLLRYLQIGFSLVVFIRLAVLSAASITSEKEAGSWPILLTTPLDDKAIVRGKAIAALRRNLPLLLLLIGLQVVFFFGPMLFGGWSSYAWLFVVSYFVGVAADVVFVIGVGLYFGVRMKNTNTAVTATVGIYIAMKLFGGRLFTTLLYSWFFMRQIASGSGPGFQWVTMVLIQLCPALLSLGIGLLAARSARRRLRKSVF